MYTMRPRLFFVRGVLIDDSYPTQTMLVPDWPSSSQPEPCDQCLYFTERPPHDVFVEGFDELLSIKSETKHFLAPGPPLISTKETIKSLENSLTGGVGVKVGYRYWEQAPVNEKEWFSHVPLLGALYVTAICDSAYDQNMQELPRCKACGKLRPLWWVVRDEIQNYSISFDKWPKTDLFLLQGGTQDSGLFITEVGLEKLYSFGINNLDLVELKWA